MFKIGLLGKKYVDTILHVNNVVLGETNNCTSIKEKLGGCFNFLDSDIKDVHLECITRGVKIAYIVCDTKKSTRSSFVINSKPSNISLQDISFINREFDWIHVCYLDDLEDFSKVTQIKQPFSLDFCTDSDRSFYVDIMNMSKVIFDSRHRKILYKDLCVKTPIIFHDEFGFEIVKNRKTIHLESMIPLALSDVNGAGDLYAAYFLKNYQSLGIIESARLAMKAATTTLVNREKQ